MTIKIEIANWKHIDEQKAVEFVLNEVRKDVKFSGIKTISGEYLNGIEYHVTFSH